MSLYIHNQRFTCQSAQSWLLYWNTLSEQIRLWADVDRNCNTFFEHTKIACNDIVTSCLFKCTPSWWFSNDIVRYLYIIGAFFSCMFIVHTEEIFFVSLWTWSWVWQRLPSTFMVLTVSFFREVSTYSPGSVRLTDGRLTDYFIWGTFQSFTPHPAS